LANAEKRKLVKPSSEMTAFRLITLAHNLIAPGAIPVSEEEIIPATKTLLVFAKTSGRTS
jgi:hypothetical protein